MAKVAGLNRDPSVLVHDAKTPLITSTTLGSIVDSYNYDSYGDLSGYQAAVGSSALYNVQVTRDDLGRIATRNETIQGASHKDSFTYDSRGRLTQVTRDGTVVATYTYDGNSNRTSVASASTSESATFDAQDRLVTVGSTSCTYSSNGELTQKQQGSNATALTYNGLGLLKKVVTPSSKTIEYLFDGEGRRIGKRVNRTLAQGWIYKDALAPVATVDTNGTLQQRYVYASRPHVPDYIIQGASTYRIIADERGSVRLVVDSSTGEIKQRLDYDTRGAVTGDTSPGFQPFGFAGGLYDSDTGLVHFGARDYDPALGRFVAKDPTGLAGGLNVYAYAANDPINFIDRDGHFAILIPIAIGAFTGALDGAAFGIVTSLATSGCIDWGDVGRDALVGGALGGISGGVGGWLAGGAGATAKAEKLVTVTSWADKGITPDLNPGRWVQVGEATNLNFIKSGLPGPKAYASDVLPYVRFEGPKVPFANSITGDVPASSLQWPPGFEVWKGILGQRVPKP